MAQPSQLLTVQIYSNALQFYAQVFNVIVIGARGPFHHRLGMLAQSAEWQSLSSAQELRNAHV